MIDNSYMNLRNRVVKRTVFLRLKTVNTVVKVCYECATGINYNFLEVGVF